MTDAKTTEEYYDILGVKSLWLILNGRKGESYVRAYVWCSTEEEEARRLFSEKYPDSDIKQITRLFGASDEPFVTELSDSGFDDES